MYNYFTKFKIFYLDFSHISQKLDNRILVYMLSNSLKDKCTKKL